MSGVEKNMAHSMETERQRKRQQKRKEYSTERRDEAYLITDFKLRVK